MGRHCTTCVVQVVIVSVTLCMSVCLSVARTRLAVRPRNPSQRPCYVNFPFVLSSPWRARPDAQLHVGFFQLVDPRGSCRASHLSLHCSRSLLHRGLHCALLHCNVFLFVIVIQSRSVRRPLSKDYFQEIALSRGGTLKESHSQRTPSPRRHSHDEADAAPCVRPAACTHGHVPRTQSRRRRRGSAIRREPVPLLFLIPYS